MLGGVVQAGLETLLLLVFADVEEELEDGRPLVGQHLLEGDHVLIAATPNRFLHQAMHAHDQDILVVAAVEDHDLAFARRVLVDAPQIVMGEFVFGGGLKARHPYTGRVHALKDMANDAVLAAGVHGLQHDQYLMLPLGKEDLLQHFQPFGQLVQVISTVVLIAVKAVGGARIPVGQTHRLARSHAETFDVDGGRER